MHTPQTPINELMLTLVAYSDRIVLLASLGGQSEQGAQLRATPRLSAAATAAIMAIQNCVRPFSRNSLHHYWLCSPHSKLRWLQWLHRA